MFAEDPECITFRLNIKTVLANENHVLSGFCLSSEKINRNSGLQIIKMSRMHFWVCRLFLFSIEQSKYKK